MIPITQTVAGLLLGLGVLTSAAQRGEDPAAANARARLEAARQVYQGMLARAKVDPNAPLDPEKVYQWSRRWMEAARDLGTSKEDKIAAAADHLGRMKAIEAVIKQLFDKGFAIPVEVPAQAFFRLQAEQELAQARAK
jgi:hypothetical protein